MTPPERAALAERKACPAWVPEAVCGAEWLHAGANLLLDPAQLAAAVGEALRVRLPANLAALAAAEEAAAKGGKKKKKKGAGGYPSLPTTS